MRSMTISVAAALFLAATPAHASEDEGCTKAPKEQWLKIEQLAAKLGEQGYTISEIELEGTCAEAKVRDKDGRTAELYLDPTSGAVVEKEDD